MSPEKARGWIPWILVAALLVTNAATLLHYTREVSDLEKLYDERSRDWRIAINEGDRLGAWPEGHPYYELCRFGEELERRHQEAINRSRDAKLNEFGPPSR